MAGFKHFHNRGFGWTCLRCEAKRRSDAPRRSRLMREGEAEKSSGLSSAGIARWTDADRRSLECTVCGASERLETDEDP